jgi:alkylation response protein AidB-like acyl-CoA dehydrogenase
MTISRAVAFDAEKENMVLDAVERFAEREIKPVAQRLEHADEWPADIVAGMREMGLFGRRCPGFRALDRRPLERALDPQVWL